MKRFAWLALCAPLTLWSGCFTEAGNPDEEQEMTAVLRVATALEDSAGTGAPDSVRIEHLDLDLVGVDEYSEGKRKRTLWEEKKAKKRARFAAGDTLPSHRMASRDGADSIVVRLRPAAGAEPLDLDTVHWESFSGTGYVKGTYTRGGITRRFLFALPDSARFSPVYTRAALEAWRDAKGYHCLFLFRPRTWMAVQALDSARAYAIAGGDSVVVFDATRNAALHRALLRRFGRSFNDAGGYGAAGRRESL